MSKRRKLGREGKEDIDLDVHQINFDLVRKELIQHISEEKWNFYIVGKIRVTYQKKIRFTSIEKGQSLFTGLKAFSKLSFEEKLQKIMSLTHERERIRRYIKNIDRKVTRKIFNTYVSKREMNEPVITRALVCCMFGEIPDFLRRVEEKGNISDSNVSNRLFLEMKGVLVPKEIIDLILSYIVIDKTSLFRIGITCSSLYLAILQNWKEVTVTEDNFYGISLLVLQNVRTLVFKKNIGKIGIKHVFSHTTSKLRFLKLLFTQEDHLYGFLRDLKSSLGPFPNIKKLEFCTPYIPDFLKTRKEKWEDFMMENLYCNNNDKLHMFDITKLFPSLEHLVYPPYLERWFQKNISSSSSIKKLKVFITSLKREDYEKEKMIEKHGVDRVPFSQFCLFELIEMGIPNLTSLNIDHFFISNPLVLKLNRNYDRERQNISDVITLLSSNFHSLQVLSLSRLVVEGTNTNTPEVDISNLYDLKSLKRFRITNTLYTNFHFHKWNRVSVGALILPKSEFPVDNLKEIQMKNVLFKFSKVPSIIQFLSVGIHHLEKLDLSFRLLLINSENKKLNMSIVTLILNNMENLRKFQYRVYQPKGGFFLMKYQTKGSLDLCSIGIPIYKEHSPRLYEGSIQQFTLSLLQLVLDEYFSGKKKDGFLVKNIHVVNVKVESSYQGRKFNEKVGDRYLKKGVWEKCRSEVIKLKKYEKAEVLDVTYSSTK